ncbi:MAG TPA: 6-carboxytetrahydropterin synthase QueD [Acidimicrobiales bacterium]|nr:6-carboxytetrahydropterin synthase QueD [Acidimicrobiales bacterium]
MRKATVFREFGFEAAHRLPHVPDGHKCARLHGHSFRVEVHVTGPVDPDLGWVMDFADVRAAFAPLHDALDHRYLNEVPGLENPTSEHLAAWIWEHLVAGGLEPSRIVVRETCTAGCVYEGPGWDEDA